MTQKIYVQCMKTNKKLFKNQNKFQHNEKYSVHESKKLFKHHEKRKFQ